MKELGSGIKVHGILEKLWILYEFDNGRVRMPIVLAATKLKETTDCQTLALFARGLKSCSFPNG